MNKTTSKIYLNGKSPLDLEADKKERLRRVALLKQAFADCDARQVSWIINQNNELCILIDWAVQYSRNCKN
jgi:hypothetical protein